MFEPRITAQGRLTSDPILRYGKSGKPFLTFTLAVNPRIKGYSGEWDDAPTVWLQCISFHAAEETNDGLAKGDTVFIEGDLTVDEYTDKTGQPRQSLKVTVRQLGRMFKPQRRPQPASAPQASYSPPANNEWGGQPTSGQDWEPAPF